MKRSTAFFLNTTTLRCKVLYKMNYIRLNLIYLLFLVLFTLDSFNVLNIKSQELKYFVYVVLFGGAPFLLIRNCLLKQPLMQKLFGSILPLLVIAFITIVTPVRVVFQAGNWNTQTVLYQNKHFQFKKIEFQMQDLGAFGYNKRTVEVTYITSLFMLVKPVSTEIKNNHEWQKVNIDVNELELTAP